MKIAIILIRFPVLTETFILNRITGLIDRGHDVDIFAWTKEIASKIHPDIRKYQLLKRIHFFGNFHTPPDKQFMYIIGAFWLLCKNVFKAPLLLKCLRHFPRSPKFSLRLLYSAVSFLGQGPYDIIHCNYGETGLYLLQLKKILGLEGKLVISFHGYDVSRFTQTYGDQVYDLLFTEADLCLAVSGSIRQRLVELGCDERKILVHHSGIDLKRFKSIHCRCENKKVTNVISVGFTEKKGLEYGIRAAAKLVSSGYNIHYTIVGDGPLKGKIQSFINDHNMENVVTLCGSRDQTELIDLLADADFMIAPSITSAAGDQEGIPNVLKEAMAIGLPVISTRHAGIPELVHEGISGFLVPERDIDAIADRMSFLIRHPEKAVKMGKAGTAFVRQEYDIDKLNDRLVMCYDSLLT